LNPTANWFDNQTSLEQLLKQRKIPLVETCPVRRSLEVIGDRWSFLIVRNAFDGMRRFGEFQRDLRLSKSVLASRLHELVENDILQIVPGEDGSAYQQYELTEKGRGLFYVIVGLRQWGEAFLFAPQEEHSVMMERASGKPVGPLQIRSRAGTLLSSDDVVIQKVDAPAPRSRKTNGDLRTNKPTRTREQASR
jgi:DNA-binding HxlR family transcriptional regulator